MKKEHWLYLVIVALAIWIIASYATAPKTEAPDTSGDDQIATTTADINNTGANVAGVVTMNPVAILEPNKGTMIASGADSNIIKVSDQAAGGMVKIDSVSLTFNGWVGVHETDASGNPAWMLGAQRFDTGSYTGGQVELLRATTASSKYIVMLHNDDGDKMFDLHKDLPFMQDGQMVMASFVAQ